MSSSTSMPPAAHSLEAERTTLGALLMDPQRMIEVAPILAPDDFYDTTYGTIYRAMQTLYEERTPIDFVTVAAALKDNSSVQKIGGSAFLAELASDVPTASHAEHYARMIREKSLRRQLQRTGTAIANLAAAQDKTAAELLETAEQKMMSLSRSSTTAKPVELVDLASRRYDHYTALYEAEDATEFFGIRTGFAALDHLLTGLAPGHLMILAGRPSMGKTALSLDIARNVAAKQGKIVTIFSLEMTTDEVADRFFAGMLKVDTWRLKKGNLTEDEYQRMGSAFDQVAKERIFIDDDPDTTLQNLRSKARRQQIEHGLDLLIVDYLQLIEVTDRAAGENQTQRITFISKSLKNLARELGCPVIALSQLSRSCEQRSPPIPILSDLRDSGAIEQDADSVLMLYRQGYYDEDCDNPQLTDLYLRKNRHGPTGHVELSFQPESTCFESIDRR